MYALDYVRRAEKQITLTIASIAISINSEGREVLIIVLRRKKRSIFRNDFFGIKDKLFMWRITNSIRKRNHWMGKLLESLLNITMSISIPITEEEAAKLEKVYESYQNLASDIENDMKRMYWKIYEWRND